jgi:methylated-DNA-[protein]-cysteine S-methyltransferase
MPHVTFITPLGTCAIAWSDAGITRFLLPDPDRQASASDNEPPDWIKTVIDRVQRHLCGDAQDFSDLRYDFERVPPFQRSILRATLGIKCGHVSTYGEIAAAIGQPASASRAVGSALGSNPWPLLIPCHRVLAATGSMTGFSGPGGVTTKVRLLAIEGAQLVAE